MKGFAITMDLIEDAKTIEIATKVILFAGNARDLVAKALNAAYEENFEEAKNFIIKAEDEVRSAHRIQTEIIQSEARGETVELSLLLTHAQDTLMVALSEINMAKQMLRMYQKFSK